MGYSLGCGLLGVSAFNGSHTLAFNHLSRVAGLELRVSGVCRASCFGVLGFELLGSIA